MRTFYEFFCGGGMARAGLGKGWRCLAANDIDPVKCAAYRMNFDAADLIEGDIHDLTPGDLPGMADLAWASFPCQDLSLAGARSGLSARRSGAFWGFWALISGLVRDGRAPRTLVIENVSGLASSAAGRDLAALLGALTAGGYAFDVRIVDAAAFLPQSRPRLFIVGWRADAPSPRGEARDGPALSRALAALPPATAPFRRPLPWPDPPRRNVGLADLIEPGVAAFDERRARAMLNLCAPAHRARLDTALDDARKTGAPVYGCAFRRMRGGTQRAEIRFDIAGCLRTPTGGSSKQYLVIARPDGTVAARWLTGREAVRLMGLSDDYRLPASETRALKIAGDGVAVPVVRWIAGAALAPLLDGSLEPAAAAE